MTVLASLLAILPTLEGFSGYAPAGHSSEGNQNRPPGEVTKPAFDLCEVARDPFSEWRDDYLLGNDYY